MAKVTFLIVLLLLTLSSARCLVYDPSWAKSQSYYAAAAYCSPLELMAWNCTACNRNPNTVVTGYAYDPLSNTFGYVAVNSATSTITVAFRGTQGKDVRNWMTNALVNRANATFLGPDILVHEGFLNTYTILRVQLIEFLRTTVNLFPSYEISLTGHSLGGALATLCAADLAANHKDWNITTVITFGSPRVGNENFSTFYNQHLGNITFREVHFRDVVPHVPIEEMNYNHVAREVWYDESYSSHIVCDSTGEDAHCSKLVEAIPSIENHLLYHKYPISSYCCSKTQCPTGLWGSCCDNPCPNQEGYGHCYFNYCKFETGKCITIGLNTCKEGWWSSEYCDQRCPKQIGKAFCKENRCSTDTGFCISNGLYTCLDGWWSSQYCDKPCPKKEGKANCRENRCTLNDGFCIPNGLYTCIDGWWGSNYCEKPCPKKEGKAHCKDNRCLLDSGFCVANGLYTCIDGWWGAEYCDKPCSCGGGRCHVDTGTCL